MKTLNKLGMFFMLYKGIIVSFVTFFLTGISSASDIDPSSDNDNVRKPEIESFTDGQPPKKSLRSEKLSQTQCVALYFIQLLRDRGKSIHETSLHKLIYFANGLHYALHNKPLLDNFYFEAYQYGPVVPDIQKDFDRILQIHKDNISNCIKEEEKVICSYTINAFSELEAVQLSGLTHEADTPWVETRQSAKSYSEMYISPEREQKYFTRLPIIFRHYIQPFLRDPATFKNEKPIAIKLIEGDLSSSLSTLDKARSDKNIEEVRKLTVHLRSLYYTNALSNSLNSLSLGDWEEDRFVSSQQSKIEGVISSILFNENFIRSRQLDFFYDPYFRMRVAISAGLNDLTAIYYLQQIFETFSNNPKDDAAQKAQKVQSRLEVLAQKIIDKRITKSRNWQEAYDQSLAHFYLTNYDEAIKWMDEALENTKLPEHYRRDILHRAFYITDDSKYITQALNNRFKDFHLQQATKETLTEKAFVCYENAIVEGDLSEACFNAGRMILRGNYTVPQNSPLWNKMKISALEHAAQIELGESLVKQSIKSGVSEALTYYVESYLSDQDIEKKLAACDLAKDMPFAQHQKGEILESQFKLPKALEAYKKAGELLGFPDAMRLSSLEEQKKLEDQRKEYKVRLLNELYEDYSNYVQEE